MRIALSRCTIRPWHRDDRENLIRHGNNRRVWRNLTDMFPHPYTVADAEAWFGFVESQQPLLNFAIEVGGQAAGGIGLMPRTGVFRRTAEFGYWLGEGFWGQGIASEAAMAVAGHGLDALDFARLEAGVFAWNPASMRVLEKAGFVKEGVLRRSVLKDGELIDRVLYARLRED